MDNNNNNNNWINNLNIFVMLITTQFKLKIIQSLGLCLFFFLNEKQQQQK